MRALSILVIFIVCLSACGAQVGERERKNTTKIATTVSFLPTVTQATSLTIIGTQAPSPTPEQRLSPQHWQEWPIIPTVSPEMRAIFDKGIEQGNNATAFIKIGDGEISTIWFLTQYDLEPVNYHLGNHTDLLPVINHFSGSFGRVGLAAGRGYNTSIILDLAPAGTSGCEAGESRLACEMRIIRPSFALISLGTNQIWQPEIFETELRQIVENLLEAGIVPILATKADNLEGDQSINRIISQIAFDYNVPLWNFWLAVQPLPEHGLQDDREHLTYAYSDFSNSSNFQYAWPWRNLTALQVLDRVYQAVSSPKGDEN